MYAAEYRAGIGKAAALEGAVDDDDAAGPDHPLIGDAAAEGGVADQHLAGRSIEDARIRAGDLHGASPQKANSRAARPATRLHLAFSTLYA